MDTSAPLPSKPPVTVAPAGFGLIAYAAWIDIEKISNSHTGEILRDPHLTTSDKLIVIGGAAAVNIVCAVLILMKINVGRILWALLTIIAWLFLMFSTTATLVELITPDTLLQALFVVLLFWPGAGRYFTPNEK